MSVSLRLVPSGQWPDGRDAAPTKAAGEIPRVGDGGAVSLPRPSLVVRFGVESGWFTALRRLLALT